MQRALEQARDPDLIPLALGLPAAEFFPTSDLREAAEAVLGSGPGCLQYGAPDLRLKEHIVELMRMRGVACAPDNIFITSGAQQALALLAHLLLPASGGAALVEEAVYPGFQQALGLRSPRLIPVPMDATSGIDLETAEQLFRQTPRSALFYTVPVGHNPLALTMSPTTRARLVELAAQARVPVIEDDVYGFLQYEPDMAPPLRALDSDWVLYVGSFSKIIAPSLRVGWIAGPAEVMTALSVLKESLDINMTTLGQQIVCHYLDRHPIAPRIEDLRCHYRARRDAMQAALAACFPANATWQSPAAGFFFWVQCDTFGDTETMLQRAIENGVSFVPGPAFSPGNGGRYRTSMRLSFSSCPIHRFHDGTSRIAAGAPAPEPYDS